jgi:hypothetical protein
MSAARQLASAELARFSVQKLEERWTDKPAQKQVLSNIVRTLKDRGVVVTREQRQHVAHAMQGRQLHELANVLVGVLTAGS